MRQNRSGHCYLEFIEKDPVTQAILARSRGTIWANTFQMLSTYFESETGQPFTSGLKVLVRVSVEFHEIYGFSLNVVDIDPTFTLGEMAKNRLLVLKRLEEEGVLTLNKELPLPELCNRIAVISSPTAAGYEDFCDQLKKNPYGLVFYTKLFPAIMQGEKSEASIIAALERIYAYRHLFDAVAIMRRWRNVGIKLFRFVCIGNPLCPVPFADSCGYWSRARRNRVGYSGTYSGENANGSG